MAHQHAYPPHPHGEPDAWHRHSAEEGMPQSEHAAKINTNALLVAFIGIVVTLVVVIGATIIYTLSYMTDLRQRRIETTVLAADHADYKAKTKQKLGLDGQARFGWASPDAAEAGKLSIPLEMAMDRVMKKYGATPAPGAGADASSGGRSTP